MIPYSILGNCLYKCGYYCSMGDLNDQGGRAAGREEEMGMTSLGGVSGVRFVLRWV